MSASSICGFQISSGTAEMSVIHTDLKFCLRIFIKSLINQSLSSISTFEAVGINTKDVFSGFLPTKSKRAFDIDLFVSPPDVSNSFISTEYHGLKVEHQDLFYSGTRVQYIVRFGKS